MSIPQWRPSAEITVRNSGGLTHGESRAIRTVGSCADLGGNRSIMIVTHEALH